MHCRYAGVTPYESSGEYQDFHLGQCTVEIVDSEKWLWVNTRPPKQHPSTKLVYQLIGWWRVPALEMSGLEFC